MKLNIRSVIIVIVVLVAVVVLVRVRAMRVKQLESMPSLKQAATPVSVAKARLGRVEASVDEQGVISSETESAIAPQVMARCIAIYKREGDSVRAGEVIARLDDQELQNAQAAQIADMAGARETAAAQGEEIARAREDFSARNADVSAAESTVAAQMSDVEAARQNVAAQQADVDRVKENLAAAKAAAATQKSRTARDKILYDNKAISLEQWETSQTTEVQAYASVAAMNHQIDALSRSVDAANHRVTSLLGGVDAAKQRVVSLRAMSADARQRISAQKRTAAAAGQKVNALASTAAMGRTRLGYTVIRAPYDAIVTARLAEPGDLLAPGQPVYRILKPGSVKVAVNVPQESLSLVRLGSSARLSAHGQETTATVSRIYPALSGGRLGTVEIDLRRPPFGLKSGSTLDVALQTKSQTGLTVPSASVLDSNRGSFVYVVERDTLRCIPVKVELQNGTDAVISGGIQPGARVVTAQSSELAALHDGQKVVPSDAEVLDNEVR